jgi:hypothetical protein
VPKLRLLDVQLDIKEPNTPGLVAVQRSFTRNAGRLIGLSTFPPLTIALTAADQTFATAILIELTGNFITIEKNHPKYAEFERRLEEDQKRRITILTNSSNEEFEAFLRDGLNFIEDWAAATQHGKDATEAWLASQVIGCWTVVETLAGDLWEAALNSHPGTLIKLRGNRSRIRVTTQAPTFCDGMAYRALAIFSRTGRRAWCWRVPGRTRPGRTLRRSSRSVRRVRGGWDWRGWPASPHSPRHRRNPLADNCAFQ